MEQGAKVLRCAIRGDLGDWLLHAGGAMAMTTYQAGRIVLAGWDGRDVAVLPRQLPRPMGMAMDGDSLAVACRHDVIFFANCPALAPHYPRENARQYDALFLPRATYRTGALSLHDLAFGSEGLWLVNTRFSCLCLLSRRFGFVPTWRPPFVSALAPEDRCHLNGLAMADGRPKFVTAHACTDQPGAWRAVKASGGVVLEVDSGQTILSGLCMPHSPRLREGGLWFLNSGTGELCLADAGQGRWQAVCALPGYARGLCFVGGYALVGLSKVRSSHLLEGLPVQRRFAELVCGVAVVELSTGRQAGMLEFTDGCDELYDVQFLPGLIRPSIVNLEHRASRQAVTAPEAAYWLYEEPQAGKGAAAEGKSARAPAAPAPVGRPDGR